MPKISSHRISHEKKLLNIIWVLVSVAFLTCLLLYNWQHSRYVIHQKIQINAQNTQDAVERLFDDLMQSIYTLPILGAHFTNCESKLLPTLQQAVFKNPKISGLAISDNQNHILCSTLPHNYTLFSSKDRSRLLFGPLTLEKNDKPFFLLQQRLGNYHIGVYFLQSILEEILRSQLKSDNYIIFLDNKENKTIMLIKNPNDQHYDLTKDALGSSQLQTLENLSILVGINSSAIKKTWWLTSIGIILFFCGFSFILYYLTQQLIKKRYSLQGNLKYALKNHQFFPVYQPIFDNVNKRFCGAEVLLRWKTIDDDMIMPETFIEEAEKTELILDITLQIAETALKNYATILKPSQPFYLAFNISAHHFMNQSFFLDFLQLVKKHGLLPQQIMLELTERDIINKNELMFTEKMQQLRNLGFMLAIDDFGTGHANISYLQHFPFNYLKIDKLFVQAIGTGSVTESLIDTIIKMAKTLQLAIIAEGIECIDQVQYLKANQVQFLQGWYYAKAMTIEELRQLL